MAEDKPRLARLTGIITYLQSGGIITARQIADKYDISIRTIYRDIRTLEQSGIPIISEEGKGYSLMEGYKLPPVMFSEKEALALIMAEQLIAKNKDQSLVAHYQNAITKIKSVLRLSQKTQIELLEQRIQVRNNSENEKSSDLLISIQSAIANFQLMEMEYCSLDNVLSSRKLEPFAVYTTNGNWVMIAFCRLRKDFRAFRLDRIQSLQPLPEHFEPHKISLEEYLESCREKYSPSPDIPLS